MKRINLKDIYPFYETDCFITVNDGVAEIFDESRRSEQAWKRKLYRHRAHFSLNRNDGIEVDAIFSSVSPYEIYERKLTNEQLYSAIAKLPDKQAKRIYAHFFQNMSKSDIAKAESVSVRAVCNSIERGLAALEKELRNFRK